MEKQKLMAELMAVNVLTNFCSKDVIKNQDAIGNKFSGREWEPGGDEWR